MQQHLKCEFCNSRVGPILAQDMGEGRMMHLCPRCRGYIREGIASESSLTDSIQVDGRELAKAVIPHLATAVRSSTGVRKI